MCTVSLSFTVGENKIDFCNDAQSMNFAYFIAPSNLTRLLMNIGVEARCLTWYTAVFDIRQYQIP